MIIPSPRMVKSTQFSLTQFCSGLYVSPTLTPDSNVINIKFHVINIKCHVINIKCHMIDIKCHMINIKFHVSKIKW